MASQTAPPSIPSSSPRPPADSMTPKRKRHQFSKSVDHQNIKLIRSTDDTVSFASSASSSTIPPLEYITSNAILGANHTLWKEFSNILYLENEKVKKRKPRIKEKRRLSQLNVYLEDRCRGSSRKPRKKPRIIQKTKLSKREIAMRTAKRIRAPLQENGKEESDEIDISLLD